MHELRQCRAGAICAHSARTAARPRSDARAQDTIPKVAAVGCLSALAKMSRLADIAFNGQTVHVRFQGCQALSIAAHYAIDASRILGSSPLSAIGGTGEIG